MKKPKSKAAPAPSPYMLPIADPPIKRPVALRWLLAVFVAWLFFLVTMASDHL